MPEAQFWKKLRRLRLDFEEKYHLQEKPTGFFSFEKPAKSQIESSWIGYKVPHSNAMIWVAKL